MNRQDKTSAKASHPAPQGRRATAGGETIFRAVVELKRARLVRIVIAKALAAAIPAGFLTVGLIIAGRFTLTWISAVSVLWAGAVIVLARRAAAKLTTTALAKDADDHLGSKDTLTSALDFIRNNRSEWMCRATIAAGARVAGRVAAFAVYRPGAPRRLAILCAAMVGMNVVAYAAARAVRSHIASSAARSEQLATTDNRGIGTDRGDDGNSFHAKTARQAVQKIELKIPTKDPGRSSEGPAVKSTTGSDLGESSPQTPEEANVPKGPQDGRVLKDDFADAVTKINSDLVKDLKLKDSTAKQGSDMPVLKLDAATIEQMLKGLKEQKEERKKEETAAQVAVGIQAKAPPGSKTTSGSPGGGGEGGSEGTSKTEDTRVEPRRIRVGYVDFPIPIEGVKGSDPEGEKSDKDKKDNDRVGDLGMLLSRRGAQVEGAYQDSRLPDVPSATSSRGAEAGWIPFGMKDYIQRYFELLEPKETRK